MVDPFSVKSIIEGMNIIINNDVLRAELISKGLERVKSYTWNRAVMVLQDVFSGLLK